jgi:hypothetical protein
MEIGKSLISAEKKPQDVVDQGFAFLLFENQDLLDCYHLNQVSSSLQVSRSGNLPGSSAVSVPLGNDS